MSLFDDFRNNDAHEMCRIVPEEREVQSPAATFCRVLGIITWIGGLIIAISGANVPSIDRYGYSDTSFSFVAFLTLFIVYAIAGGFLFCLAELFENVKSIAVSLKCMRVMSNPMVIKALREKDAEVPDRQTSQAVDSSEQPETARDHDEEKKGTYTIVDADRIKCNNCGYVQRAGRKLCWNCGVVLQPDNDGNNG